MIICEGVKEAQDLFDSEANNIISNLKVGKLSKQESLQKISELHSIIKSQQTLETDFDTEYNPQDTEFNNEMQEALAYAFLLKEINELRVRISKMIIPDNLNEIGTISDYKDDHSDKIFWDRYADHKDSLKYLKNLASYELWGNNWPLSKGDHNRFYFKDAFGQPVGFASFLAYGGTTFRPVDIYFLKDARRQGLGSALYSFLLDNNVKIISDTDQTEASKGLWKSLYNSGKYDIYLVADDKRKLINNDDDFKKAYYPDFRLLATKKK